MKILAQYETPRAPATAPGRVILVDLERGAHPLVTWWENTEDGGRYWGHYFTADQSIAARNDYLDRVKRGY